MNDIWGQNLETDYSMHFVYLSPSNVMLNTILFLRADSGHKLGLLGQMVTSDVSMVDNDKASGPKFNFIAL